MGPRQAPWAGIRRDGSAHRHGPVKGSGGRGFAGRLDACLRHALGDVRPAASVPRTTAG